MPWNRTPLSIATQLETRVDNLKKKGAREFLRIVYVLSPVKTGRYKSNHIVSIGFPTNRYDARRRDYARWYAEGIATINSSPRGASIFIQQNLPYAPVLENGSSSQAPAGIYRIAHMRVNNG